MPQFNEKRRDDAFNRIHKSVQQLARNVMEAESKSDEDKLNLLAVDMTDAFTSGLNEMMPPETSSKLLQKVVLILYTEQLLRDEKKKMVVDFITHTSDDIMNECLLEEEHKPNGGVQ